MAHYKARSSIDPGGESCPDSLLRIVSENIGRDVMKLGSTMGIKGSKMETIELDEGKWGTEEIAFKTLETWRRLQGENATLESLTRILQQIGREDIAGEIAATFPRKMSATGRRKMSTFLKLYGNDGTLTLKRLQANLRQMYERLEMKGLPWMNTVHLSLEKHFVQMKIVKEVDDEENKSTEVVELEQMFKKSKSRRPKRPTRILVEGDAGFGKTTIATKLCYDYGTRQNYLNHFDIVLYFPLRNFDGEVDEMLCSAAFVNDQQQCGNLLKMIRKKSVRTLLLLDGYDELPNQHDDSILALIRGEVFPNVTVLVTSRPGRLNSEPNTDSKQYDNVSPDFSYRKQPIWHLQVKIVGISHDRQPEFLEKHLSNFTQRERELIAEQITQMNEKYLLTPDFLQCPLFILMIVLLLSQKTAVHLQYLKNQTELYKSVMNFVIRRYLTKHETIDFTTASTADLFSFDNSQRPFYVDLMAQLGEICLTAINDDSLSISRDAILGPGSTIDPKILDLGILNQTVSVRGFWNEEFYEPVHKSLMEFAAAYFLLTQFMSGSRDQWNDNVIKLRPSLATAGSSLTFPFLAGLLGKDAKHIFKALMPYAAEYTHSFECLTSTLREAELTDSLLSCLTSFIPLIWETNSSYGKALPPEVMLAGLKAGNIEQIVWDVQFPIRFCGDVSVKSLLLTIGDEISPLKKSQLKRIECDYLICEVKYLWMYSKDQWNKLLVLLRSIQFKEISLAFGFQSVNLEVLPVVYETFTNGELKEIPIHYIECGISKDVSLDKLVDLIEKERIGALSIELDSHPSQHQLDTLFTSVSKSSRLTSFLLINEDDEPFKINLSQLLSEGQKSYDWLCIHNAKVECDAHVQKDISVIKLCQLRDVEFIPPGSSCQFFRSCQLQSFYGNCSLLDVDARLFHESLTELDLKIDESFWHQENFSGLTHFSNLRLLTFTMTSFECQSPRVAKSIFDALKGFPLLKRINIDRMEKNLPLTKNIVEGIAKYLDKSSHPSETQPSICSDSRSGSTDLSLKCLSLMSEMNPAPSDPSKSPILQEIVSILSLLKQSLKENALSRLDLVPFFQSFLIYMSEFKPNGFSSFVDVFPPQEGFIVRSNYWGMREDDPLRHKMYWNIRGKGVNRFSVSCHNNEVTDNFASA